MEESVKLISKGDQYAISYNQLYLQLWSNDSYFGPLSPSFPFYNCFLKKCDSVFFSPENCGLSNEKYPEALEGKEVLGGGIIQRCHKQVQYHRVLIPYGKKWLQDNSGAN